MFPGWGSLLQLAFLPSLRPSSLLSLSLSPSLGRGCRLISPHLDGQPATYRGKWVSLALQSACFTGEELMRAYPDLHACVKSAKEAFLTRLCFTSPPPVLLSRRLFSEFRQTRWGQAGLCHCSSWLFFNQRRCNSSLKC